MTSNTCTPRKPWALQSSEVSNGPIAVVGMSFTMPQGINSDASLWEILATKKNVMTEWPASRANVKGFTDTSVPTMPNTVCSLPLTDRRVVQRLTFYSFVPEVDIS